VLAIAQAQPQHGGTGALYVLLKRLRDDGAKGGSR
jgi:DNA-nicking Smr family endonuclease